ncbi:hypothetical protein [Kangiella marina]|uniref:Lipoprotein n=1 Tax=Kangiella marina TaxID=1079178 RepID=A0ABP8IPL5_9GAMM
MKLTALSVAILVMSLMGCKTTEWNKDVAVPAVAVNFNSEAKAEVADIINQAMPGANVKLANDIFSKDHRLFIQREPTMVDGNPAQGRITEMPRKFELYHLEDTCFLVDDKTQDTYLLGVLQCQPK